KVASIDARFYSRAGRNGGPDRSRLAAERETPASAMAGGGRRARPAARPGGAVPESPGDEAGVPQAERLASRARAGDAGGDRLRVRLSRRRPGAVPDLRPRGDLRARLPRAAAGARHERAQRAPLLLAHSAGNRARAFLRPRKADA